MLLVGIKMNYFCYYGRRENIIIITHTPTPSSHGHYKHILVNKIFCIA